jgi:hypothetical protein
VTFDKCVLSASLLIYKCCCPHAARKTDTEAGTTINSVLEHPFVDNEDDGEEVESDTTSGGSTWDQRHHVDQVGCF